MPHGTSPPRRGSKMRLGTHWWGWLGGALVAAAVLALVPLAARAAGPTQREIAINSSMFAYDPPVIRVQQGDRVVFKLSSSDVVHGFYLDAYGVNVNILPGQTATAEIVADKVGKFRYRCSFTCGNMHPFMVGEMVVEPNYPFSGAAALTLLVALGTLAYVWRRREELPPIAGAAPAQAVAEEIAAFPAVRGAGPARGPRYDLMRLGLVSRLLRHRAFQYFTVLPNLFFFTIIILATLFGTPVGNHNFAIIFVWIVWWALLIVVLIPFGARVWCTMCPLPVPGEWLQRLALVLRPKRGPFTLGWVWPESLRNIWLQNLSFLAVAIFSGVILTVPLATGIVLLAFIVLPLILSLIYQRRAFCRYLCPVGGFIGLYSMVAPLELRVKDPEVCRRHCGKECLRGSANGYGCPWLEYPGTMTRNAYCGLCTECIKTCPIDNIAVNIRPFGADLLVPKRHLDEAYKALIMLTCAVLYSAVIAGPWGWVKDWANMTSAPQFIGYAAGFLTTNLLVVPGMFLVFAWAAKTLSGVRSVSLKRVFVSFAYALVPLGLMGWIAFSVQFLLVNYAYILVVLSDPFGWGWDLFGTRHYPWAPLIPELIAYLQVPILLAGLALSIILAYRLSRENFGEVRRARRALVPIAAFLTGVTLVFLRLYLG